MNESPYAKFIKAIEPDEKDLDSIGTITSVNPLKVKVGDLEIDKDNILINPLLLQREERVIVKSLGTTDEVVEVVYSDGIDLKAGDDVLIVRNGQWFVVVCKVVSL